MEWTNEFQGRLKGTIANKKEAERNDAYMQQTWMDEKVDSYKIGVGHMKDHLPGMVEAYHHFTAECFKEGQLPAAYKQLIALGISLTNNNELCTLYHVREALSNGVSREQVLEAVSVAAALGGAHAMSQGVTRVQRALDAYDSDALQ